MKLLTLICFATFALGALSTAAKIVTLRKSKNEKFVYFSFDQNNGCKVSRTKYDDLHLENTVSFTSVKEETFLDVDVKIFVVAMIADDSLEATAGHLCTITKIGGKSSVRDNGHPSIRAARQLIL